jgi:hypothetical protein
VAIRVPAPALRWAAVPTSRVADGGGLSSARVRAAVSSVLGAAGGARQGRHAVIVAGIEAKTTHKACMAMSSPNRERSASRSSS